MADRSAWSGKVAIVTGASAGIGLACVQLFVAQGMRVAAVARTASKLDALADALGRDQVLPCPLDVTDRAALLTLPQRVHAHFGRLDVLVNNAGLHHRGLFGHRTAVEIADMVETNLTAPMLLTHAALPLLAQDGVVIQVASIAGKSPLASAVTYSSTKFALRNFSLALTEELRAQGSRIRLCNVNPGPVDTGFFGEDLGRVPDVVFSQPLSTAEQIAEAVWRAVAGHAHEIDVPGVSGKLATLAYLFPSLGRSLRPTLDKLGARNKAALIARRRERGEGRSEP